LVRVKKKEMQSRDKCKTQLKSCLKAKERSATKTCKIEEDNIRNLKATKSIQQ
jgi:hypothetical protein